VTHEGVESVLNEWDDGGGRLVGGRIDFWSTVFLRGEVPFVFAVCLVIGDMVEWERKIWQWRIWKWRIRERKIGVWSGWSVGVCLWDEGFV